MNKKIPVIILIAVVILIWFLTTNKKDGNLASPGSKNKNAQVTSTPAPLATPQAPKSFQFDASTNLEAELEKVNPEVLDSDFE